MSSIAAVSTALPKFRFTREQITEEAKRWLSAKPQESKVFERFLSAVKIDSRSFVMPLDAIVALGGMSQRAEVFEREGLPLGQAAVTSVLSAADIKPKDIDAIIFTSCTGSLIPTLDTHLINTLGFNPSVLRVPIYQYGCAGGASGLALAHELCKAGKRVLLASVEICSLEFQRGDVSGGNLLGAALFSDGAAAVIITPEQKGVQVIDSTSILIPNSQPLMGYDMCDDGPHLRLLKELPSVLAAASREHIPPFLKKHGLTPKDVTSWLFHPGGVKILEVLEEAFELKRSQAQWSWDVLAQYGNMSSATALFVLDGYMKDAPPGYALMLGVGPGLSVQLLLMKNNP
jgi:alkylresorcinol/alkylpyrone synthase